jgi:23S rRNA (adenine2503-C2)-methyltransferase
MGEPLLNLDNLRRALAVINCKRGINFSVRRVTVSTCGISEGIIDLADNGPAVRLALSLTAADEELRRRLMPGAAGRFLERLRAALRCFRRKGGGRVTLEAVLLGGLNTRLIDVQALSGFARGLDAVFNLIPWNPVEAPPEFPLRKPTQNEMSEFIRQAESLGLKVTRRYRKGLGVSGACGQLAYSDKLAYSDGLF